jgi:hypothetical protein
MTKRRYAFAILVALALAAHIPHVAMAQNTQSSQVPTAQAYAAGQYGQNASQPPIPRVPAGQSQAREGGRQTPQPVGGVATVVGVDEPENCLRVRSGPGSSYEVIGCANMGDQLNITGVWTSNGWAQLADNGWVYGAQIQTDLRPARTADSHGRSYVAGEEVAPDYDNWAYLPDYGYDTYWYGGVPLFSYDINVWRRYHPWWWHRGRQGRRVGNRHDFRTDKRAVTHGNWTANRADISSLQRARAQGVLTPKRANISSPNINRLNSNRFPSKSADAFRSRTFSNPTAFRSGASNAFRSHAVSSPSSFRSGTFGASSFRSSARSGGFSSSHMGGGGRHR